MKNLRKKRKMFALFFVWLILLGIVTYLIFTLNHDHNLAFLEIGITIALFIIALVLAIIIGYNLKLRRAKIKGNKNF